MTQVAGHPPCDPWGQLALPSDLRTVAALYIDPGGPYPKLEGVDCFGEYRDAMRYVGPHPVVAHPPCGPWGQLRHVYRGNEHDCAPRAVEQLRGFGGVLEHPATSQLWPHSGLPLPGDPLDAFGGYSIEVEQCEWGHVARKRTWLYLVGVPLVALTPPPYPGRKPTHWVSGRHKAAPPGRYRRNPGVTPAHIKICSAQQRRRTPPAFAEWLVSLARSARRP